MRKKTNQALPYGRMYSPGQEGVSSERAFKHLVPVLGSSAATTYFSLRQFHLMPASLALSRAREQCQKLGKNFPGGLGCVAFRLPIFTR